MFFKRKEIKNNNFLTKVCALLIHAAKIDENYTDKEEEIIKKTINELGIEDKNISKTIEEAKIIEFYLLAVNENNSNLINEISTQLQTLYNDAKQIEIKCFLKKKKQKIIIFLPKFVLY